MGLFDRWMKSPKPAAPNSMREALAQQAVIQEPAEPAAPEEPSILAELLARLNALAESTKAREPDGAREFIATHCADLLKQMVVAMGKTASGMRSLSVQSAHGAAHLDPNVLGRILDRMDSLGDATLRQIEGRMGVISSREERKELQILRDEMRAWMDARDHHLQEAQMAVDELSARAHEMREGLLGRSERLAKTAEMAGWVASPANADPLRQASQEAGEFSEGLRWFLEETRFPS